MFLDFFQLSLEKAWFTNFLKLSVDRPNTTHKLMTMWNVMLEFFEQQVFPLFFLTIVFGHKLNFNWENSSFLHSYIIGDLCMPL